MCHHIASLGHLAIGRAILTIAQHGVVAFGGIVNPGVEIVEHAGVDAAEEVEHILRIVVVAWRTAVLIPVDEVFGHPHLLALLSQFLASLLDAAILMTAIDVEIGQHVRLVQFVDVCRTGAERLGSDNLTVNLASVGHNELCYLACRPDATGIRSCPIGFVLNGNSIEFNAIVAHILDIVVKIHGIVVPVFALQLAYRAVLVLGVDSSVGLPLRRLSPWRCKDNETFLLGILCRSQRLSPRVSADRDIEAHDVAANGAALAPHLVYLCIAHVVVGKLRAADKAAKTSYALIFLLRINTHSSILRLSAECYHCEHRYK